MDPTAAGIASSSIRNHAAFGAGNCMHCVPLGLGSGPMGPSDPRDKPLLTWELAFVVPCSGLCLVFCPPSTYLFWGVAELEFHSLWNEVISHSVLVLNLIKG
jgi:hypothetical protein